MLTNIAFSIVGFAMLVKGADILIDGACSIAKRYNVSDLVVGLTIVALGTSAPELAVSVLSALNENTGMAIGNVMGSNIANICLALGIAGLITPITIKKGVVWREIPFCLGASLLLLAMIATSDGAIVISRFEAAILLVCLCIYLVYMFRCHW